MTKLLIGTTLLNQFRVENFIAAGGMATIYRVWDLRRGVPLAMKVLHPELASDPVFIARFQREARALEALSHPHIVPFYGMYRAGDLTFLLQMYVDGPSLDEVMRHMSGAPMSLRDVLVYFKALYTSLGYAHAQGIIHCDVKPGNVLIDQGGHVYLSDFGIARYAEAATTTSAIGTPIYMAPEQVRGDRLRPETDIYSLGVMLYEMLTANRPFSIEGEFPPEAGSSQSDRLRYAHQYLPPIDPREFNPAIPPMLAKVLLKALSKDPQDRYPNMQAMAEAVFGAVATRHEALPDRVRLPDDLSLQQQEDDIPPDDQSDPAVPYRPDVWEPVDEYVPPPSAQRKKKTVTPRLAVAMGSALIVLLCLLAGLQIVQGLVRARGQGGLPAQPSATQAPGGNPPATETPIPESSATQAPSQEPASTVTPEPMEGGDITGEVTGQFVIVQREAGRDKLFILDIASGEKQALPSQPGTEWSWAPQWSPDGRWITWVSQYSGRSHILVVEVGSQELRQIEAGEQFERVHSPAWLADSQRVSFWALKGGKNSAVIAEVASGDLVDQFDLPVYRNLFVWNWSSSQVAYAQQTGGVYEVGVSSSPGTAERIFQPGTEAYAPAWSRDGQWLAFQGSDDGGDSEIWVARADGSEMRRVTSSPDGTWSRAPTWSPDGKYLGFVSSQAGSAGADLGELFIVELATGKIRQVTSTGGLVYDWRPDWKP